MADAAADHDVDAFHGNPAARPGIAFNHQQATVCRCAGCLRGAALDPHSAGHHVFRAADTDVAVHGDRRFLVHPRAVVTRVALDIDGDGFVDADRQVVRAIGMRDQPFAVLQFLDLIVQGLIEITHGGAGKIDGFHGRAPSAGSRSQMYMVAGTGSQTLAFSIPGRLDSA